MKTTNLLLTIASFCAGLLFFAYHNQWIIIQLPWHTITAPTTQAAFHKKPVTLKYWQNGTLKSETQQLLWHESDDAANAALLITTYFSLLDEEWLINKKISVTAATCGPTPASLIVSLSDSPLNPDASTAAKWHLIEGLLQTLREQIPALQQVTFLVNHQPLQDAHLDFTRPWPIIGFKEQTANTSPLHNQALATNHRAEKTLIIMLDPAGDAQNTGRTIDDSFERGLTLQYAQALKQALEAYYHDIKIVVTRELGETIEPLQQASVANRIGTGLFVHVSIYQQPAAVPTLNFYHFLSHPTTDFWKRAQSSLSFEPYHEAHRQHAILTQQLANTLYTILHNTKPLPAILVSPLGLPYKPLLGITAPALAIEIGVNKKQDWQPLVAPVADALIQLAKQKPLHI